MPINPAARPASVIAGKVATVAILQPSVVATSGNVAVLTDGVLPILDLTPTQGEANAYRAQEFRIGVDQAAAGYADAVSLTYNLGAQRWVAGFGYREGDSRGLREAPLNPSAYGNTTGGAQTLGRRFGGLSVSVREPVFARSELLGFTWDDATDPGYDASYRWWFATFARPFKTDQITFLIKPPYGADQTEMSAGYIYLTELEVYEPDTLPTAFVATGATAISSRQVQVALTATAASQGGARATTGVTYLDPVAPYPPTFVGVAEDSQSLIVTTGLQEPGVAATLALTNISITSAFVEYLPEHYTFPFTQFTPSDLLPFRVQSAVAVSPTAVEVTFTAPVWYGWDLEYEWGVSPLFQFTSDPPLDVVWGPLTGTKLRLYTSPQTPETVYTVTPTPQRTWRTMRSTQGVFLEDAIVFTGWGGADPGVVYEPVSISLRLTDDTAAHREAVTNTFNAFFASLAVGQSFWGGMVVDALAESAPDVAYSDLYLSSMTPSTPSAQLVRGLLTFLLPALDVTGAEALDPHTLKVHFSQYVNDDATSRDPASYVVNGFVVTSVVEVMDDYVVLRVDPGFGTGEYAVNVSGVISVTGALLGVYFAFFTTSFPLETSGRSAYELMLGTRQGRLRTVQGDWVIELGSAERVHEDFSNHSESTLTAQVVFESSTQLTKSRIVVIEPNEVPPFGAVWMFEASINGLAYYQRSLGHKGRTLVLTDFAIPRDTVGDGAEATLQLRLRLDWPEGG